ncbi:protein insensitive-like [Lucilia sericata]|uniref:protein insensitive-like n=1 Tax=Lucilia sericata TaxID=13632 RepID=UPI0018A871D8|nr:protein insensitive-like [Lucilia sericata]XP_037810293.1 protein insensitive-like [Lucilia sericata]
MEAKMVQLQPMTVMVGSANKFKGILETEDRPLMVNAWSQTTSDDFSYLYEIENLEKQSQREKELEEKIKILEENLKAHSELLSQIHATSARTSALLSQQQQTSAPEPISNVNCNSNTNSNIINGIAQSSPKIVNTVNSISQVNCSPSESVKYTIIAEGIANHSGEPIEIELAEDDGALNLNSSADSERLEICLEPEENIEVKTEYNIENNRVVETLSDTTPNEQHFIKKRKLTSEQLDVSYKPPVQKRFSNGNSLPKTGKVQIKNIQTLTPVQINKTSIASENSNSPSFNSEGGVNIDNVMVSIGPNNTRIPAKLYENMNWTSASIATRKLLMAIFDRKVLATHSMTGRPSPAFKDQGKPLKQMLDPLIIADIIFAVTRKCNVSDKEVRNAITTKCADENKMMKLQINKRTPMRGMNKENMNY